MENKKQYPVASIKRWFNNISIQSIESDKMYHHEINL